MTGTGLWFVTPAYARFEIVAVCLEQRRRVIEELGRRGIEAHQVVIADDENLDIARELGAETVERDNAMVGRKFNDGYEYAGRHGADWIVPIGSDSWIDPDYFDPLPEGKAIRTSPAYCAVTWDALHELWVAPDPEMVEHTAGPHVFRRDLLEPAGWRPCLEDSRMTDTDTLNGIKAHQPIDFELVTLHPFQYVGFRVPPMMTRMQDLWRRWGVERYEPWDTLERYYDADLVAAARRILRE